MAASWLILCRHSNCNCPALNISITWRQMIQFWKAAFLYAFILIMIDRQAVTISVQLQPVTENLPTSHQSFSNSYKTIAISTANSCRSILDKLQNLSPTDLGISWLHWSQRSLVNCNEISRKEVARPKVSSCGLGRWRLIWVVAGQFVGFVILQSNELTQFELRHDKTNKMSLRPAKTQTRLGGYFAVRMKKPWVLSYPLSTQQRLWSDWADAQADLSLRWVHSHFVGFVVMRLICMNRRVHKTSKDWRHGLLPELRFNQRFS